MSNSSSKQGGGKPPGSMGNTPGTNFGNANHSKAQVGKTDRIVGKEVRHTEQNSQSDQNDSLPRNSGNKPRKK